MKFVHTNQQEAAAGFLLQSPADDNLTRTDKRRPHWSPPRQRPASQSQERRRGDAFWTCFSLLTRQFQRAQLPISSSPGGRASSARGTGTSEPRRNHERMQHAHGITDLSDRDRATTGRRRRRIEAIKLPLLPSGRAAGPPPRAPAAGPRAPAGKDALEMAPNPQIQTAHVQSDGF